jgi:hypothetical protein
MESFDQLQPSSEVIREEIGKYRTLLELFDTQVEANNLWLVLRQQVPDQNLIDVYTGWEVEDFKDWIHQQGSFLQMDAKVLREMRDAILLKIKRLEDYRPEIDAV